MMTCHAVIHCYAMMTSNFMAPGITWQLVELASTNLHVCRFCRHM